ncbi:class I SAM-dependent methyltransferase [Mucilaginibacter sp.]|uniref:class I SAM-dependent methyltransferase n=1 Tax=Mucilaginibacter sp. TaxID=1882438 RepID=UPI00285020E1|nr:class I SAM-dependent methyltransferase [Mucilaginibacter sp.]MDR3695461.1 class I SAM-dependent methyltransferase [Mucilaginibacter sp.]
MNKEYYAEYFKLERTHWWFKVRERIIEDVIKSHIIVHKDLSILNIGAATGRTSEMLSKYGTVKSLEYDEDCCEFTRQKLNIPIIHGSILYLPFPDNSFDLVCAIDVIEHIEDDKAGINEMERVCKSNGNIFITVPAFAGLWSHHDVVNQHFRRYRMPQVVNLFGSLNNGRIIFKSYFNSLLFPPVYAFRKLSKIIPEKWIRRDSGSDFSVTQSSIINKLLFNIFYLERLLLKFMKFPVGVSIIFLWKKN